MNPLHDLLRPRSIAVVGASADPGRIGSRPVRFLQDCGFEGEIFPVNPRYDEILGLPCYASLSDAPVVPDAVVVVVPAALSLEALREARAIGVKLAVVLSSGVSEEDLRAVLEAPAGKRMRVIGPNTSGVTNVVDGIPLAMSSFLFHQPVVSGGLGLVSQSGGLASPLVARGFDRGIGFSHVLLAGNQIDVGVEEMLDFLVEDESTKVIGCILEGTRNASELRAALGRARMAGKPVMVLKTGRSIVGAKAAVSHTAALAGDAAAYDALFAAEGAIVVSEPEDLLDIGSLFVRYLRPEGGRIGVLSVSGGGAVLLADLAEAHGLELPEPSVGTTSLVTQFLGDAAAMVNPLDLTGKIMHEPDKFRAVAAAFLDDVRFDVVVVGAFMNTMSMIERVVRDVIDLTTSSAKPLVVVGN